MLLASPFRIVWSIEDKWNWSAMVLMSGAINRIRNGRIGAHWDNKSVSRRRLPRRQCHALDKVWAELGSVAEELQLSSDLMRILTGLGRKSSRCEAWFERRRLDEMTPNAEDYTPGDYKGFLTKDCCWLADDLERAQVGLGRKWCRSEAIKSWMRTTMTRR
jgi:hypothetical protein